MPQASLAPVRPRSRRSASMSVRRGSTSSSRCSPFTRSGIMREASNRRAGHANCKSSSGTLMKIAQIAPLAESVPPKLYGGTERVVSYLTEELVRLGHDVTLFASGDSETTARLVACAPRARRFDPTVHAPRAHQTLMIEHVRRRASEFDVLHFHLDHLHLPVFRPIA